MNPVHKSQEAGRPAVRNSIDGSSLIEELERGMARAGLSLDGTARRRMTRYAQMLAWRGRGEDRVVRQLLDSLEILPHLAPGPVADVGSGEGLPGIPLAIARPGQSVTLIDSHHEKARFLRSAKAALGLESVEIVAERVESWQAPRPFHTVVSRALCDLEELVRLAGRLCVPGGTLVAVKPMYPYEELAQLPPAFRLREVIALDAPGGSAGQHLVVLEAVV